MKVAIVSDIHGNLPALEAVLNDMRSVNADAVVCCGDLVGYYPYPDQVCELMRDLNAFVVRGNHEAYVSGALTPAEEKAQAYKIAWTRANLSTKNLRWLASLPYEMNFRLDGLKIKLRHACPWDEESYLYPDSPKLSGIQLEKDEILFVGHTHHPMWLQAGDGTILNPGSVGQPRDWNPLASYAILDTNGGNVLNRRVEYNVEVFQGRLRELGWENALIDILSRKKDAS